MENPSRPLHGEPAIVKHKSNETAFSLKGANQCLCNIPDLTQKGGEQMVTYTLYLILSKSSPGDSDDEMTIKGNNISDYAWKALSSRLLT